MTRCHNLVITTTTPGQDPQSERGVEVFFGRTIAAVITSLGQDAAVAGEDKLLGDYYSLYFYSTTPSTITATTTPSTITPFTTTTTNTTNTTTLTTALSWRGDI